MAFPDPTRPIVTCSAESCKDCPVAEKVHCHFRPKDFLHFLMISIPGFTIGGAGILSAGIWPLILYLMLCVGFFGVLEIRVLCSHCPHYAEEGSTLSCWANHGSPKLWKYRPGPMNNVEKFWFFAGITVVWGYPLPFFVFNDSWFLLLLFILTNLGFFTTLRLFLCSKCMNFACPFNSVEQVARDLFFKHNPSVARHWRQ